MFFSRRALMPFTLFQMRAADAFFFALLMPACCYAMLRRYTVYTFTPRRYYCAKRRDGYALEG